MEREKILHREIEMETKLKMKIIPRSTSKALKFCRQVRFLPDFYPDRAAVCPVRRKVTTNDRNFTIERPLKPEITELEPLLELQHHLLELK